MANYMGNTAIAYCWGGGGIGALSDGGQECRFPPPGDSMHWLKRSAEEGRACMRAPGGPKAGLARVPTRDNPIVLTD